MKYLFIHLFFLGCSTSPLNHPLIVSTSACMMGCPYYTFTLQPDYQYTLANHSNKKTHNDTLNTDQINELNNLLQPLASLQLEKTYGKQRAWDLQQIHLVYNRKKTTIYGRQFTPKPIKHLLAWVEELIKERPK